VTHVHRIAHAHRNFVLVPFFGMTRVRSNFVDRNNGGRLQCGFRLGWEVCGEYRYGEQ